MTSKKVAVAMSGGVDSSVTAALLKKQGFAVEGVFMALAQPDIDRQIARVKAMAERLGVELTVIDLQEPFSEKILGYFRDSYFEGLTPNPCVVCNREVKFGLLMDRALAGGADFMATGHYVRTSRSDDDGLYHLYKGSDPAKDQSYFLCRLTQKQLSRVIFPLGEYKKEEVYGLAVKMGLEFTRSEESQDVCFLKDQNVGDFLAGQEAPVSSPGPVVTAAGRQVGTHPGIHHFTIGQRRGLGIPDATPWYVIGLDSAENRVIVGKKEELFKSSLRVSEVNWLAGASPGLPLELEVKIRYRHPPQAARVEAAGGGAVDVFFAEPQRAITAGQFAAFYRGDELLGGGPIE
ncbi:MAG: tRNA 2-thiouridine(34) synthase MnmA [Thermodesulfobacteriota bacterium]